MNKELKISDDLTLPAEAVTQTFAILAKRGVGKTYTGCVMVEEMLARQHQVVVVDPVGVWWGLRSSADGKAPGFKIVVFGGEHGDLPLEETAGEIVAQAIVENGFSAVLDLSLFRKAAQNRFMLAFAEALYRLNRKPLHLMVDEADEFAPQKPFKGAERLLGAFEDIVRRGRARGLGVTLITQRAAVLNKNVLTQIEVLVVLRTISPQDREAIEAWTKVHGTAEELAQLSASMASLPIGVAWFWSPGWLNIFRKICVRKKTTFDSSATPKVGETLQKPKALAEVNLEQLGEQIRATVESAKANDPKELKAEVARLKKEIQRKDAEALKAQGAKPAAVVNEVAVFTPEERERLDALVACLPTLDSMQNEIHNIDSALQEFKGDVAKLSAFADQRLPKVFKDRDGREASVAFPKLKHSSPGGTPSNNHRSPSNDVASRSEGTADVGRSSRTAIGIDRPTGGLMRMMIALRQRPGLTPQQLGVRAGLSSTGGTFGTYLSRLRTNEWVYEKQGKFFLTEAGTLNLGDDFTPLPEGQELLEYWLRELGESGAGRMLRVLTAAYPDSMSREALGAATGISHTGGTFGTYVSRLRTLELIEGKAALLASREFFE